MQASTARVDLKAGWAGRYSRIVALCIGFSLAACTDQKEPAKAEFFVFGTLVDVTLTGVDAATEQAAFFELQQMFLGMHRDWHAWEPGQLTSINAAMANGQEAIANDSLAELILQSGQLETASGGRFNPAIGKLIGLWGFHTSDYPIRQPVPSNEAINALLAGGPSTLDIDLHYLGDEQWQVSSRNPAVQLDFGGVAKGYATDLAIELLRSKGIANAIVNAGGDLRAIGSNQGQNWRIAIENPLGGIIGILEIDSDEAVFTSGNYQRFGEDESGFRYAHILDPRTGWPVEDVMSATVVMKNGASADAAATALVVAGLEEWPEVAEGMGLQQFLLTDERGAVYLTRAMQARLQLAEEAGQRMVLLD
ncbi:MAG TPA: FAD:protein FMN transferase [Xanthomonadales bacterium]|nr:FAD:protein FMN transferase [Xanthomonadales bacterium]